MSAPNDRFSIGVRGTWFPPSLEWFLEDGNGRQLDVNQIEDRVLDTLTPEQRSQWFFVSTVWPRIKYRVYALVAFVLCMLCMLTLLAMQLKG